MATDDLLTEDEARRFVTIGANDQTKAELLRTWITSASRQLASRVGTIIYGTVTGELQNGGRSYVYLDRHPVGQIIQVVEYDSTTAATLTAETNASKPSGAYVTDLKSGKVTRRDGGAMSVFPVGFDNVYVTYVAGRYSSTATVDDRFKTACGLMLKNAWRAFEISAATVGEFDVPQASFPTFAIPRAAKDALGDEWHFGSGIGD